VHEFAQKDARKYNIIVFFSQQTGIDAVCCRAIDRLLFYSMQSVFSPRRELNLFVCFTLILEVKGETVCEAL
jgi:hypothetical protein